ncbi:MAG: HPF/RaiA family ribosome-associated protein [Methylocystis sp.]|nr:HPF/RaiA family ribosome-associated protein [Methylocystis sp.]MBI3274832.1 HPF/RaiA family ribosome-associated protein [Methylocystis sp.]
MQTSPRVEFQGMEPSAELRARIERRIGRLEDRYGRATACRIVVKGPSAHHRNGGLYELNIHLALPDRREVAIDRTPHLDERFQDVNFALNDAFKRARRQLQDEVRQMRGQVKLHETTPVGVVRKLMADDGYGFLESADGRQIYFHRNSVTDRGFERLALGERVHFTEEQGGSGPQASRVRPLGERAPR